jgi:hypothetical protein
LVESIVTQFTKLQAYGRSAGSPATSATYARFAIIVEFHREFRRDRAGWAAGDDAVFAAHGLRADGDLRHCRGPLPAIDVGFLVFGMPILVHVVVSYSLHRWRSSGYICLLLGMLTSALGFLAYSWYESLQPDRRPVFQLPPAFLMVQAIGLGMFAGFVPVVLEFWLRLAFDGMMLVARGIKRLIRPAAETQPQPTSEK